MKPVGVLEGVLNHAINKSNPAAVKKLKLGEIWDSRSGVDGDSFFWDVTVCRLVYFQCKVCICCLF